MALPGRGRLLTSPFLSLVILPFLIFLVSFTSPAAAAGSAVLGLDVGTEYFKATLVKPGIPLEIVLSKDSKRKESAAIAFKPTRENDAPFPERFYGGNALALAARFPDDVYINLKTLLGLPFDDETVKSYWSRYPALNLETAPDDRGSVALRSNRLGEAQRKDAFLVEEILAMQLKEVKSNADTLAGKGSDVRDVVITYPAFYTAEEKRSLVLAAELAGLKIQSLISDGLAVGLNYATSRKFPSVSDGEKPEYHVVFDMGAGSTTASVLRFQSRKVKDVGKFNKTVQEIHVLGSGWDKTLGGDSLNDLIVNDMVAKLAENKQLKDNVTPAQIKAHGKTMARLWKDAEKLRQVLSANTETGTSFEGLYDDELNFKYKITRADFEKMAAEHVARIGGPLEQALSAAGLKLDEIDSVVLHGGATRTPFVQKQLEKICGGSSKKLRTNVNADEAAAFGAAFKGAALSPSFRVKDIRASDAASYPIVLKWNSDGKERSQKLFTAVSQVGPEKQVTVKNLDDFEFSFYQQVKEQGLPVLSVQTQNLTASVNKLKDTFGCTAANITTKFNIRLNPVNGLPEVTSGNVSCEVEAEKKGSVVDDVKGFFGLGSKKGEQEPLNEDEASESITLEPEAESSTTASASSSTTTTTKENAKPTSQTKLEIIPISLKSTTLGTQAPSVAEMARIKGRLAAFDASDRDRVLREEALNELESFIYKSRDLVENEEFIKAVKEDQLTLLQEKVAKASDWLYEDSDNAKTADFQSKMKDLKAIVNPALKRMKETSTRPARVQLLQDMLKNAESMKQLIESQIANDEQIYSSSLSASSTATAEESETSSEATPTPSASDDILDDLDDDSYSTSASSTTTTTTTTTSTKSSAAAKPTGPKYTLFTPTDLASLTTIYETTKPWLETQLELQEKLTESDDPALTVLEIDSRLREFERVLNRMYERMTAAAGREAKKNSGKQNKKKTSEEKGKGKEKEKAKQEKKKAKEETKDEL